MLSFHSASVRIANSERAIDECFEIAFEGSVPDDLGVVVVNAAIGHKLDKVAAVVKTHAPGAVVLGTSCGGVVGREGAGEAMTNLAMMAVGGPRQELATAAVDGLEGGNSYEKGLELARALHEKLPGASLIYLVCAGLGVACNRLLEAFDEVFGGDVPVFGGTSADNYKGITTFQYLGDSLTEHGAWAIGFADPTLKAAATATHGFTAYGEPMTVTKVENNQILEFDNLPAWEAYSGRLGLIPEADRENVLSIIMAGGLASELPAELAEAYDSPHILRGAAQGRKKGVMYLSVTVEPGDRFWLTTRDEDLIFSKQEEALAQLQKQLDGHTPVAVFQADCLARGRTLFGKVMKDEIIGMMQDALQADGTVPPWLGMYGFGEFCPLSGKNTFHTYTTSLLVLHR
ncbi:FIST C-terminal domain-containing protein [Ruminococcaceae bacterium OttesenSCG-928-D13]|nr:FIST C-terminal domain-containing protein [Ruminococcaceae bacterium OttesenSCG-928-D13]